MNCKIGQLSPSGPVICFSFVHADGVTGEYEPMEIITKDNNKVKVHPTFLKGEPEFLRANLHAVLDGFIDELILRTSEGKKTDVPRVFTGGV